MAAYSMDIFDMADSVEAMEVHLGELVLVTAESDDSRWRRVVALLKRARNGMNIDAVYVGQTIEGRPLVRPPTPPLDDGAAPPCDGLEEAYGLRMLEQRPHLPRPPGVDMHVRAEIFTLPVAGRDGEYGTLCAMAFPFQASEQGQSTLGQLRSLARMVGVAIAATDSPAHAAPAAPRGSPAPSAA
ncbi:MAG: hypothetical protein HY854_17230 [Burkholderiales bacterium]|nr:hypothetical protein [Burkholderiales bacterium]